MLTHDFKFCPKCAQPLETITDDEQLPRLSCTSVDCDHVFWGNPTPVVGALIELNGEIVLARNVLWPQGWFALVTGYLEHHEDPVAGIAREVKEELGLDAQHIHLIGNYIFERKNEVMLCYHVVCSGTITLNHEIAETRACTPQQLKAWPGATGLAVADWLRARGLPVEFVARTAPTLAAKP